MRTYIVLIIILLIIIPITTSVSSTNEFMLKPNKTEITVGETLKIDITVNIIEQVDVLEISNISYKPINLLFFNTTEKHDYCDFWFTPNSPPGEIHDNQGWARPITWAVLPSNLPENHSIIDLASMSFKTVKSGIATIEIEPSGYRNGTWIETIANNIEITIYPRKPTNVNIDKNVDSILITWIKGNGADYTRIKRSGKLIYEGTGEQYIDKTYDVNKEYEYRLYGYNKEDNLESKEYETNTIVSPSQNKSFDYTLITFLVSIIVLIVILFVFYHEKKKKKPKKEKTVEKEPKIEEPEDDLFS
jgi:hypothetical protein